MCALVNELGVGLSRSVSGLKSPQSITYRMRDRPGMCHVCVPAGTGGVFIFALLDEGVSAELVMGVS